MATGESGKVIIRRNTTHEVLAAIDAKTLRGQDLSGTDLSGAAMYRIEFDSDPHRPLTIGNVLRRSVVLSHVSFAAANLSEAVFSDETLIAVNFQAANLRGAVFVRSHLVRTDFSGADLTGARMWNTSFSDCPTLHLANGLDSIEHHGPSSLDTRTHRVSVAKLPDAFLLGIGYTKDEITGLRKMYRGNPPFYSCFVSYARQDGEFADRLRTRLVKNDISCWQDTQDLVGGDYWRQQIYDAIEKHDKLILVCSKTSLSRPAVVAEILEAIDRERTAKAQKLFPIRLDDYVLSSDLEGVAKAKVAAGEWRENWLTYVRAYHIPDFSQWRNTRRFSRDVSKLVEALRHPPGR